MKQMELPYDYWLENLAAYLKGPPYELSHVSHDKCNTDD